SIGSLRGNRIHRVSALAVMAGLCAGHPPPPVPPMPPIFTTGSLPGSRLSTGSLRENRIPHPPQPPAAPSGPDPDHPVLARSPFHRVLAQKSHSTPWWRRRTGSLRGGDGRGSRRCPRALTVMAGPRAGHPPPPVPPAAPILTLYGIV